MSAFGEVLDQAFAAGVGNWVADEVLYQAKLHPARRSSSLTPDEVATLREKLIHVIETAVAHKHAGKPFPEKWLFHIRWNKVASKKGMCPRFGWSLRQFGMIPYLPANR
jgi:formamidopyrimidine-DNA glycosylase